jgi:hypothetical protein
MSARVETASVGRFNVGAIAFAVVVALGIGGVAGLMVNRATEQRPGAVTAPVGIRYWDAQKLEAMEGRVLAEQAGIAGSQLWDAQKLEAMAGRVLAERAGIAGSQLWDAQKLEAMAGRVLAEQAGIAGSQLWDAQKLEAMAGRVLAG